MAGISTKDISLGYKAIALCDGPSGCARRVAAALIDHFNPRTGQCDPSNGRLGALLGIDERSVRKATKQLCECRLFEKVSHGGNLGRASYKPNWTLFREIVRNFQASMKGENGSGNDEENRPKRAASTGPNGPVGQAQMGLQTKPSNQTHQPTDDGRCGARGDLLWRGSKATRHSEHAQVVRSVGHEAAARGAAERRWNAALMDLGESAYADAIERMTVQDQEAATEAEITRRGSGIRVLIERLRAARRDQPDGGRNALH